MSKKVKVNEATQNLSSNVTVKVQSGKTTLKTLNVHNTVTLDLLYGLLLGLSNNINTNKIPNYIGVGSGTTSDPAVYNFTKLEEEETIVRGRVVQNYKGEPKKDSSNGTVSVMCQGFLPYSNIEAGANIQEIGLFGTLTGYSLLARVQLNEIINLEPGQSLIVEWKFIIQNAN